MRGNDLDRKSIFDGAKKVFFNNLTEANRKNVQAKADYGLEEFNSFKDKDFTDVFGHLNVWPVLQYLDFEGNNLNRNDVCNATIHPHYELRDNSYDQHWRRMTGFLGPLGQYLENHQKELFRLNHDDRFFVYAPEVENNPMATLTLGFYKKTDQTLYYGLKGEFDYLSKNQIFFS